MNAERNQRDEQMHGVEFPDIGELWYKWNSNQYQIMGARTVGSGYRFLTRYEIDRIEKGKPVYSRWCYEIHDKINDKRYVAEGHAVDMPLGNWVVRSDDGDEFEGPYENGRRHGLWVWRKPSGTEVKVKFRNGKFVKFVE